MVVEVIPVTKHQVAVQAAIVDRLEMAGELRLGEEIRAWPGPASPADILLSGIG
jgi:hypothetical protein